MDLDLDLKMSQVEKLQLVVFDTDLLDHALYEALDVPGEFEFETFKTYNADFWKGQTIMEPHTAIRKFTAQDQEILLKGA